MKVTGVIRVEEYIREEIVFGEWPYAEESTHFQATMSGRDEHGTEIDMSRSSDSPDGAVLALSGAMEKAGVEFTSSNLPEIRGEHASAANSLD